MYYYLTAQAKLYTNSVCSFQKSYVQPKEN